MIIIMKKNATAKEIANVQNKIEEFGFKSILSKGTLKTIINVPNQPGPCLDTSSFENMAGVERVLSLCESYKLASRDSNPDGTKVKIGNSLEIGGNKFVVIAGPCSVESKRQLFTIARFVKKCGCHILRGGVYKPRTSPYSFQGIGKEGLEFLEEAKKLTKLPVVTEVTDTDDIELISKFSDILQVGTRNAQNTVLLKALGKTKKPILLKRGIMMKISEFLNSAEYILSEGNPNVILCERGIRTFEVETRATLDLSAIPVLKEKTHLPVIVDPSHALGHWKYVPSMCLASLAAGADGIMIEVHNNPQEAESDGLQSLKEKNLVSLMKNLKILSKAMGKKL